MTVPDFINGLQNASFLQKVADKWWFCHISNFHNCMHLTPVHWYST